MVPLDVPAQWMIKGRIYAGVHKARLKLRRPEEGQGCHEGLGTEDEAGLFGMPAARGRLGLGLGLGLGLRVGLG